MCKRVGIISVFILVSTLVLGGILWSQSSSAASMNELYERFYREGFRYCYTNNIISTLEYGQIQKLSSAGDLLKSDKTLAAAPTYYDALNCQGIMEKYGITDSRLKNNAINTLESLGYSPVEGEGESVEFKFKKYANHKFTEFGVTLSVDELGDVAGSSNGAAGAMAINIGSTNISSEARVITNGSIITSTSSNGLAFRTFERKDKWSLSDKVIGHDLCLTRNTDSGYVSVVCVSYEPGRDSWDGLIKKIDATLKVDYVDGAAVGSDIISGFGGCTEKKIEDDSTSCHGGYLYAKEYNYTSNSKTTYTIANQLEGLNTAFKTLFKVDYNSDNVTLSESEATQLYINYLENVYKSRYDDASCSNTRSGAERHKEENGLDSYWQLTKRYSGDSFQYCYVINESDTAFKVYGVSDKPRSDNGRYTPNLVGNGSNFNDVAKWLLEHGVDNLSEEELAEIQPANTEDSDSETSGDEDRESPCFEMSGAIGWVLCPVLNAAAEAVNSLYENILERFLAVDPGVVEQLAQGTEGDSIYSAWAIFRDVANVIFVILFLVVIFSQVTGFGIDNYGIKRMLPKIIIAAVLVNFSYLICQIAVDISNILGVSLKDFFESLGNGVSEEKYPMGRYIGDIIGSFGITTVAGTAAFLAAGRLFGWGFLATVGLSIITGLISLLFAFALLAARQAIIIVLIVLSPVAVALYMLPNTNRYFQTYVKMFSGMLLVYPSAALLMGGGYFAARVVIEASNDLLVQIMGLLLMVVPFFFIIPLVTKTMNGIAGIGGKIQAIGSGLRRGANSAVANSDWYKDKVIKMNSWGTGKALGNPNGNVFQRGLNAVTRRRGVTAARQAKTRQKWEEELRDASVYQNTLTDGLQPDYFYEQSIDEALAMDDSNKNKTAKVQEALQAYATKNQKGAAKYISRRLSGDAWNEDLQRNGASSKSLSDVNQLSNYLSSNERLRAELEKRDKSAADLIAMGGGQYNSATGQMTYHGIHSSIYGADQDMDDRIGQDARVLTRDYVDGKLTADFARQMVSPGAPPAVQTKLKESNRAALNNMVRIQDEKREKGALTLSGKGNSNVTGQSGTVEGYMPTAADIQQAFGGSAFNATEAFKTNDGHVILSDGKGLAWDATTASKADYSQVTSNIMTRYNS